MNKKQHWSYMKLLINQQIQTTMPPLDISQLANDGLGQTWKLTVIRTIFFIGLTSQAGSSH